MGFEKPVMEKIREAIENGEFDNLPGAGKPLNMDDYFSTPEDRRLTYSVLKSAGILPQEVELLKEAESLKSRAELTPDEPKRRQLLAAANEKLLQYELLMDRYKRSHQRPK